MSKIRIDQYLVEQDYFPSRQKAQAALMAGQIKLDNRVIDKAGTKYKITDLETKLIVDKGNPYASRGGHKLARAIEIFEPQIKNQVFLDIGASTGGFTDCLIQNGANYVYAIDVGYGQIRWELRDHPQIKVLERCNARHLTFEQLYKDDQKLATSAVIDVSFISLTKIIPNLLNLLKPVDSIIALIKPQFEVGKDKVGKGVVTDPKLHVETLDSLSEFFSQNKLNIHGLTYSPIKGPAGNIEFLVYLKSEISDLEVDFKKLVDEAHLGAD